MSGAAEGGILPDAAALDATLGSVLPPGSLYAVGGRVRDEIRAERDGVARPVKDLDYVVTGVALDDLLERLRRVARADVVGASFGVVKATLGGTTVDVALPRRERSTGIGHRDFAVEAGPQIGLEEDLARRDFRMNMIARALPSRELVDPYGGQADIANRRVDLLRAEAFEEDPLRMLRAAQFAARFEFEVTARTMDAMAAAAPLVTTVSPQRVRDELVKLLGAPRPSVGFEILRAGGVLAFVLPEVVEGVGVEQNEWHAYDVYHHGMATLDAAGADDPTLRLAALFHDVGKPRTKDGPHFYRHELVGETMAAQALERLSFPGEVIATVASLVRHHMYAADPETSDATLRRFVRRVGEANLARQFALRAADVAGSGLPSRGDHNERFAARVASVLSERPPLAVTDLAVRGADAIAALVSAGALAPGSRGGPAVGVLLGRLLDAVVEDPSLNVRERLEPLMADIAKELANTAPADPSTHAR